MKIYRLILTLAIFALLAGCSVGTKYSRPEVQAPETFRGAEAGEAGDAAQANEPATTSKTASDTQEPTQARTLASNAELEWWKIYGDETLDALIKTALENNYDVRVAAARVEEFRALAGVSRIAQLPRISAGAGGSHARRMVTQPGADPESSDFVATLNASYELDLWGRLASLGEAARADLLSSEYAAQSIRLSLVSDVATTYFNLLALDSQLEIARRTAANRQRFLDLTRSQYDAGTVSMLEVDRASASLSQARAAIPDIERQTAQAENLLSRLLGKNPGEITRPAGGVMSMPVPPEVPAGLPSSLLERRPDIRQAEEGLVASNARVNATKAQLYPTISLTGALGIESDTLHGLFDGPSGIWSLALGLLQPILNSERNGRQVDAAEARKDQATLHYYNTVSQAFREVSDALVSRKKYADLLAVQQAQVVELEGAVGRVNTRYDAGYSSYFEVIDADGTLFGVELAAVQAKRNTLVSLVQLYKALGGGWEGKVGQAEAR